MNWILYTLAGAVSGILSGMGIGGGVLLIPALVIFGGVAQHSAQGVNLLYFLPTAAAALWIHGKGGQLEKKVLPMLIAGGVLGALAGSFVANILEADILRKLFGGFVAIMGVLEIRKGWGKKNERTERRADESGLSPGRTDAGACRARIWQDHDDHSPGASDDRSNGNS